MRHLAWPFRFAAILAAASLLLTALVIGVGPRMWQIANAHDQTPVTLPAFQPLSQRSYVYDVNGNVLAIFERENSQPITLDKVPAPVLQAVLAVEDKEFYDHHGVNVRSFMRALLSNFSSDAPRQGASTITQQVVKNEFLAGLARDGRYKALQAHYATMLEKQMTKGQILERYLNTVFFGNNAYGLQAAAEVYFGKSVEQLTMIEGAFLAGLIRSPSGYDPIRKVERSRARFKQVVDRLVAVKLVTTDEGKQLGDDWPLPEQVRTIATLSTKPTYYTEALREYLLQNPTVNLLGQTEQEKANRLYRGGLKIHTTFDPNLQALAEAAHEVLPKTEAGFEDAIVTLDTKTAGIRAMVGGSGFRTDTPLGQINMALVPRQTGSSIKLFILAAALQAGVQPNDVIKGDRGCILPNPGDPKHPFEIKEGNIGFTGPLDKLTWNSINCAFARLSQIVGLNRVVDTIYRMGRSPYLYQGQPKTDRFPLQPYPALATGSNEMRPLDMAAGLQTIANQGVHHDPYYVDYIDNVDGTRLYTHEDVGVQVLDTDVANTAVDVLKGVLTKGTAKKWLSSLAYPAAGKTGTQQDNTNSWFVGATPQLTTAVWVGNPKGYVGYEMNNIPEFVADGVPKVQGGTYPAKIWGTFMTPAVASLPVEDWPAPPLLARNAVRLYLPGNECLARVVRGAPSAGPATSTVPVPPEVDPVTGSTINPPPVATTPAVVLQPIKSDTTIAPDILDPKAPVPSVAMSTFVYDCTKSPVGSPVGKAPKNTSTTVAP